MDKRLSIYPTILLCVFSSTCEWGPLIYLWSLRWNEDPRAEAAHIPAGEGQSGGDNGGRGRPRVQSLAVWPRAEGQLSALSAGRWSTRQPSRYDSGEIKPNMFPLIFFFFFLLPWRTTWRDYEKASRDVTKRGRGRVEKLVRIFTRVAVISIISISLCATHDIMFRESSFLMCCFFSARLWNNCSAAEDPLLGV